MSTKKKQKSKLVKLLKEYLDLSDKLVVQNRITQEVINTTLAEIVARDKEHKSVKGLVTKYRKEVSRSILLKEDFENTLCKIIGMYLIIQQLDDVKEIEEDDKIRLDYLVENNEPKFKLVDGELEPADKELIDTIYKNYREDEPYINKFLETLRQSEIYTRENGEEV